MHEMNTLGPNLKVLSARLYELVFEFPCKCTNLANMQRISSKLDGNVGLTVKVFNYILI